MDGSLYIRALESPEDFRDVERLQRDVWPGSETDVVPMHLLITVAHNGGVLLGAFDPAVKNPDGRDAMVGFVFGFLGTDEGDSQRPAMARLKHCSHQLGVLPAYRNTGIGYDLKVAQCRLVQRQGIRLITWTYDPLESRNAYLNIARLGCVCRTYMREVYGEMHDGLNRGLPSDRFQVEWWITSTRVKQRLARERPVLTLASFTTAGVPILNSATFDPGGLPRPAEHAAEVRSPLSLLEFPSDIQSVKAYDLGLARAWRLQTREACEAAFGAGYFVTDMVREITEDGPRSYYVLAHGEARLGHEG